MPPRTQDGRTLTSLTITLMIQLQDALKPSEQLVDTLQNNYLFSFTLRKAHLRGGLRLQLYDTHAGALCVRHVWPYGTVNSWNKLCAGTHQKVRRGDFIIQVNKASGNAARMRASLDAT